MGKIMLLLALMTSLCSLSQSRPIHYQAGLLKASATIAPTKFKTAAIMIAVLGLKTLVDTTVAIAFAVS